MLNKIWKKILLVSLISLALSTAPSQLPDDMPIVTDELVDRINNSGLPWQASKEWAGEMTIGEARNLLKTEIVESDPNRSENWGSLIKYTSIPSEFDSRKEWPNCIHPIMNQGGCGSCWAFGAAETLSDRFCIQKGINVVLSPEFIVDCDTHDGGCAGGSIQGAWDFLDSTGTVEESCDPYTAGKSGCISHCTNGSPLQTYKATSWKQYNSVQDIQMAIIQGGPVETAFGVYNDFFAYHNGIYVWDGVSPHAGSHAVKVLGWGNRDGLDYWLCANSWGTGWGRDGFFKIAFGQCGICGFAVAGDAA